MKTRKKKPKSLESQLLKIAAFWKKEAKRLKKNSKNNKIINESYEERIASAYLDHCAHTMETMIKSNKKKGKKS